MQAPRGPVSAEAPVRAPEASHAAGAAAAAGIRRLTPGAVLALQRAIGNHAVGTLLRGLAGRSAAPAGGIAFPGSAVETDAPAVQRAVAEYGGVRGKARVKAGITAKIQAVLDGINLTKAQQIAAEYQAKLASEAEVDEILDGLGNCFNDLTRAPDVLHAFKDLPNRVLRLVRAGVNGGRWGFEDQPKTLDSLDWLIEKDAAEFAWHEGQKEVKHASGNPFSYLAMMDVKVYGADWAVIHIHYKNNQDRDKAQIHKIHMKPTHGSNTRLDVVKDAPIDAAQAVVGGKADGDFPVWNNYIVAAH